MLGAAVAQAAFFLGQKPLLRRYGSLELTTWAMALGTVMALPLAPGLPAAVADAGAEPLIAVGFLGVGASAVGFVTWAYACARVDVSLAAACLYAVPVVAFGLGWVWLGEEPAVVASRRRRRYRRRGARDALIAPANGGHRGGGLGRGSAPVTRRELTSVCDANSRPGPAVAYAGRNPNPRNSSSARPPSVPGFGSTPSATAAP